jgi:hypothetical protein
LLLNSLTTLNTKKNRFLSHKLYKKLKAKQHLYYLKSHVLLFKYIIIIAKRLFLFNYL